MHFIVRSEGVINMTIGEIGFIVLPTIFFLSCIGDSGSDPNWYGGVYKSPPDE